MARRKSYNQLVAQFNRLVTNPAITEQRFNRVMIARNRYGNNMGQYAWDNMDNPRAYIGGQITGADDVQVPRNIYMGSNAGRNAMGLNAG